MTHTTAPVIVIATCSNGHTTRLDVAYPADANPTPGAYAELDADALWQRFNRIACRCGRAPVGRIVHGKRGKRECGKWCTEGRGKGCTCECGGTNHGAAYQAGIAWYGR